MGDGEEFGRYRLVRPLGRGGMGEVFEAYDTVGERRVAVKRLLPHMADDEDFQKRFRREARLAARLRNPHVVPIHTYGEVDGRLFLEMRLVDGRDLQQVLVAEQALEPERAVSIVGQVAAALGAAHDDGLVHRDVKPSNVLIDTDGAGDEFVYLADFGITRLVSGASQSLTASHVVVGSLDYMAPEQFDGNAGPAVDIYSLGCVLFQCLTGSTPFPVEGLPALMKAHTTLDPPLPSERRPELGTAFDEVVVRALAKDPAGRPGSAAAFVAAMREALRSASGSAQAAPVAPPVTEVGPRPTRIETGPGAPSAAAGAAAAGAAAADRGVDPAARDDGSESATAVLVAPGGGSLNGSAASATPAGPSSHPPSGDGRGSLPGTYVPGAPPPDGPPPGAGPASAAAASSRRPGRLGWLVGALVLVVGLGVGLLVGLGVGDRDTGAGTAVAAPAPVATVASSDKPVVAARYAVPGGPETVAISPDGLTAYLATTEGPPMLSLLDVRSGRVTATVPIPGPPYYVNTSPSGDRVYVSYYDRGRQELVLGTFDVDRKAFVGAIPTGQRAAIGTRLTWVFGFAVSRDGTRIYVPNQEASVVSVLDAATSRPLAQIPVPATPHWVALTPDGRFAYVANHMPGQLTVLDTTTNTVAGAVPIGAGVATHSAAVSPDGRIVESANYDSDTVSMVDTTTNAVIATVPVGDDPQSIVFAPDGAHSYVVNEEAGTVSVISTARHAVVDTVRVGDGVSMVAVSPDGRTALVAEKESSQVAVLNIAG